MYPSIYTATHQSLDSYKLVPILFPSPYFPVPFPLRMKSPCFIHEVVLVGVDVHEERHVEEERHGKVPRPPEVVDS